MAGREEHVDLEAGKLQPLATRERVLGVPALERAEVGPWDVAVDVRQDGLLDLRHPHLGAGGGGHGSDRTDVVDVGVGEQDRVERHAQPLDRAQQLLRLVARIDDHRAVGAVAADQEAVLLDQPDREHPHVHGA